MKISLMIVIFFFAFLSIFAFETLFYENSDDISEWTIINGSNHSISTSFSNENPSNYDLAGYDGEVISTDVATHATQYCIFDAKIQTPAIDCDSLSACIISCKMRVRTFCRKSCRPTSTSKRHLDTISTKYWAEKPLRNIFDKLVQ